MTIERKVVDGRPASVAYYDARHRPVERGAAAFVNVLFDDGQLLILSRDRGEGGGAIAKEQERIPAGDPRGGQFAPADGGGGDGASGARPQVEGKAGKFKAEVEAAIAGIPADHAAAIKDLPIRVVDEARFPGQTNMMGYFESQGSRALGIVVGQKISRTFTAGGKTYTYSNKVADPGGVVAHEIGHALDHKRGWGQSARLESTFASDIGKLRGAEKAKMGYYLGDRKEMFAEVYRMAHGPKPKTKSTRVFGGLKYERAEQVFAASIKAMKEIKV